LRGLELTVADGTSAVLNELANTAYGIAFCHSQQVCARGEKR